MAMREECKHFQSRTYEGGEAARFCELDLAPEAPWSCPAACPRYARRLADVGWVHGSLVDPPVGERPDVPVDEMVELLGNAEAIVAEAARSEARRRRWPFGRRR